MLITPERACSIDDARVHRTEGFEVQPQPPGHRGREAVDHRVGLAHEVVQRLLAAGRLQVQRDAALAPVDREEEGRVLRAGHGRHAAREVAAKSLHLDDLGAELREELAREGAAEHPAQVQDAFA
jgi:hypothetical protein